MASPVKYFAMGTAMLQAEKQKSLEDAGVDPEKAALLATVFAVADTAVEKLEPGELFGPAKAKALRSGWQLLWSTTRRAAGEMNEEFIQQGNDLMMKAIADVTAIRKKEDEWDKTHDTPEGLVDPVTFDWLGDEKDGDWFERMAAGKGEIGQAFKGLAQVPGIIGPMVGGADVRMVPQVVVDSQKARAKKAHLDLLSTIPPEIRQGLKNQNLAAPGTMSQAERAQLMLPKELRETLINGTPAEKRALAEQRKGLIQAAQAPGQEQVEAEAGAAADDLVAQTHQRNMDYLNNPDSAAAYLYGNPDVGMKLLDSTVMRRNVSGEKILQHNKETGEKLPSLVGIPGGASGGTRSWGRCGTYRSCRWRFRRTSPGRRFVNHRLLRRMVPGSW